MDFDQIWSCPVNTNELFLKIAVPKKQKKSLKGLVRYLAVIIFDIYLRKVFSQAFLNPKTLIWVGFLGVSFKVGWGGKITPCLKPVRIKLETSNLARKYTPICSFRKYTFQCVGPLNFADVSIFLNKNWRLKLACPKKYLYSKKQCESCVRDFLVLFSVFLRQNVSITENIIFADSVSRIQPPGCSRLA